MASQKIDELQIQIGSDASDAIRQLGNLATALNIASSAAARLGSMSGALKSFSHGIENLTRADLNGAIDNLTKLSRINLNNLKDKKVNIDISISGADRMDRLRYAASQAERDIGRSVTAMGKTLGQDLGMKTDGIKTVQTILHDMAHDVAGNGNAAAGVERLKDAISETARVSTADLTGMRREYEDFLKDVETLSINPGQISKDEMAEWKKMGLERLLQKGGQRIDTDIFGFDSDFLARNSSIIDAFSVPMDAPDQFVFLREKILEAKEALNGFVQTDAVTEKIDQIAESYREKIQSMMEVATSKRMTDSADKIPIDLNIDQTRFEKQIQDAINAATDKEYSTKPIRLKIDNKQLQQSVEAAFTLIDLPRLPQFAAGFSQVADAISLMNQTDLRDTGITTLTNAMRRLADVDTSRFNPAVLQSIVNSLSELARVGDVSNALNRFIASMARLANAGDNTRRTAYGLDALIPRLRNAVRSFIDLGSMDSSISQFITSLSRLATAGNRVQETAVNLDNLTRAVLRFLRALRNSPQISDNLAMTIQGLGNLAAAGQKTGRALDSVGSTGKGGNSILSGAFEKAAGSAVNSLKGILNISLRLGGQGASALGHFMQSVGLLPGAANGIDRTSLSFSNLLRAILPFYGIRGIFDWAKQSFEAGSSIVELRNVIDTAFGSVINGYRDISGYIYKWSQGTIDAFGISEIAAQRYAGRLMSMFNSSGFDATEGMRDSAAKMTTELIERAGDIASFYEITVDEAMTKMQAAMAGMSRPMRALGVNMNVANLEAFALEHGINQSWQSMNQATQMAVRYAYMLEKTRYAEGDFAATSMSASNQAKLLSVNIGQLSATFGQGLVPAIAPVLAWLNALIKRLIQAANAFRLFMFTLFGKPLAAAKGMLDETAGYLDDAAGAAGDLGSAGGGAADGLGSAGKAAKDLKKQLTLLPFDQLNQLAKDTDSAGSGGSGGGAGGGGGVGGLGDLSDLGLMPDYGDLFEDNPVVEAINMWAARIREAFQKHQWANLGRIVAEGINAGFKFIYDVLEWNKIKPIVVDGFITPFQTAFNSMMDWIDWPLIGKTFGRGLMVIVNTLSAWIAGFHWRDFGVDFAEGMNAFIYEIRPEAIGALIAHKFKAAWDFFGGWVSTFNFSNLGYTLRDMVLQGIAVLDFNDMGSSLAKFINGLADTIIAFLGDGQVKEDLSNAFSEFVNSFIENLDAEKVKKAIKIAVGTVTGVLWETFKKIDMMPLIGDLLTILSGLPWGLIGASIAMHAVGALKKALVGGVIKKTLSKLIVGAITGGGGGGAGATGGGVLGKLLGGGAAKVSAAAGGIKAAGATAMSGVSVAGLAGVVGSLGALAALMRHQVNKTGGVEQFQGQNLAPSYQQPTQQKPVSGQNAAGYNTQIQAPKFTGPVKAETLLTGKIDPSFLNLETAKASLMETPFVQKIMNGELTADFKDGYKKFTDTKAYNTVKGFGASVSGLFRTWWDRNIDKKNYSSTKGMNASIGGLFSTWWPRNIDKKNYSSTKGMNASIGGLFSSWWPRNTDRKNYSSTKGMNASIGGTFDTWWWRNTDRHNYSSTKGMNASIGDRFDTWWWRLVDRYSYPAVKSMNARDAGKFVSFTDLWQNIHDKWVDINVSIVKKTSDLGAWIKGKWEELVSFEWFAKGGMFTGPTAISVFGEAGAEAAIPLERKSTMKRIGNAIVSAGGMGTSNSDDIADAVAERLAPIIMSAVNGQGNRPINVNATLYTENNEVLARAVNQGNRSLDKRYNPVSQYSY